MTVSLRRAPPRSEWEAPAAIHAPLFQKLLADLDPERRYVVLDLGAASTSMLSVLREARCCVEIADVAHFGDLDRLNREEDLDQLNRTAESLLPLRCTDDPVDLVFCWDLLNFLTPRAMHAFMSAIGARSRSGAVAHALVYYADKQMPALPGRFIPGANRELTDHRPACDNIDAPRYSPEKLDDHMGGFAIERARLLGNGMQEFLFRF